MKKNYILFTLCMLASVLVSAERRYWVGPMNGNWNNANYWSATSSGSGGAGVPGDGDEVTIAGLGFNRDVLINIDISPTIHSLTIGSGNVTLYTSIPTIFTVTTSFNIWSPGYFENMVVITTLKDSTSADVPFNFVVNRRGSIGGNWEFEGGVPVSAGNGPTFTTAPDSSLVSVEGTFVPPGKGGRITYKRNTPDIVSTPATLIFYNNSSFILDNNPDGAIPDAYWLGERFGAYNGTLVSSILITGNLTGELRHLSSRPSYGSITADLYGLTADASLALPHGTLLKGNLNIQNTNNHTLTLLSATGSSDSVVVAIGLGTNPVNFSGGFVNITANPTNNTKVALARATSSSPATNFRLQVNKDFEMDGGNFSLQDYNGATGSSTLGLKGNLKQSRGTFFTNSTATGPGTQFIVEMDAPPQFQNMQAYINVYRSIDIISGTIDNGRNMVTLRINHPSVNQPTGVLAPYGVFLHKPLEVGRLDLIRGPLNTTSANVITVNDPDITTAVKVDSGFVHGPVRRRTNSTKVYVFPTGKGNTPPAPKFYEPCEVIPASAEPSMYQAEYFHAGHADTQHIKLPLTGISTAKYWNISKVSGSDASVQLTVRGSRVSGATNRDGLVVARYADGQWVSEQGSVRSPGDTTAGSVVSKILSAFGPFTFGYHPATVTSPLEVKCPSNMIVNTDQNSCNALVRFKAESGVNSTLVYKIGSTVITSPYAFSKGTTTVDVTASDSTGTASCSFTVTVNDVQAPSITGVSSNPATLSPADDALKNVFIDYTVTDNCGPVTTTLSVTSNQTPTGNNTDWEIADNHNVRLRATQSGEDRIYTITITGMDESGNQSVKTVNVTVPKTTVTEKIKLDLKVMPNPSKTYFTLYVRSNNNLSATLQVFDLFGRVKEVRRFYPDATIRLGDNYRPGVYFVKITQGNAEVYTALVKLPG